MAAGFGSGMPALGRFRGIGIVVPVWSAGAALTVEVGSVALGETGSADSSPRVSVATSRTARKAHA
jgi:hypothetical protein